MKSVDREEAVIAGRPKKMVKRVERLEVLAYELASQIRQAMPQMHRDNPETTDPIGAGWKGALKAAIHLWTMVEDLGDDLRHKAGIERAGPTAYCRLRDDGMDEPFCPPEEDDHVEAVPPPPESYPDPAPSACTPSNSTSDREADFDVSLGNVEDEYQDCKNGQARHST